MDLDIFLRHLLATLLHRHGLSSGWLLSINRWYKSRLCPLLRYLILLLGCIGQILLLLRHLALLNRGHRAPSKLMICSSKYLKIEPVSIVLDSDGFVARRYAHLLDLILLDKLKEGLVAEHGGYFQLVFVPCLIEARLDVALVLVEVQPVDASARLTDEGAVCDAKMRALVLATVYAESVEVVLCQE